MRWFAICFAALLVVSGCSKMAPPDEKALARERWNNTRASIMLSLALDQYKGHDFDKCRETIAQALKMTPDSAPLHTLLGKVDIEQGQLEQAEKELEVARASSPKDPEPYYLSGVIYQRWQKADAALAFYRQASERAPAELAYILPQGEMLVVLHRGPEALQLLQSKVAYFENSPAIRDAVGQLLVQAGRYGEAADLFRQASILAEDDLSIRERMALAYYSDKQYAQAAPIIRRLVEKDPYAKRADLFEMLGECQIHVNDPRGARNSFETATSLNPYSAHTWQSFGRAALEAGDLKRADFALRRAIGIDASISETHLLTGYVRLKESKLSEALASFQKAATLDPKDTTSLCMVGYVYEKMGRTETAMQYYARALKIKPGDDMASQLMAGIDK